MIPLQLTLKNFLSYCEAKLDFRGLRTACICGANGAGKSSLLEAITWATWGQSRTATEDDVIHAGEAHVRVDFQFISGDRTYRIIRSRQRGRSSSLEFQIQDGVDFRSLTAKGVRATQQQIITTLKLDYDTFVNSAYLRQGRADEFMLRRPTERKQILADLLKLERYEALAYQAKDIAKQLKGHAEQIDTGLKPLAEQLAQKTAITTEQKTLSQTLAMGQQQQERSCEQLAVLQEQQRQRQTWQEQLDWQQNQYHHLIQDCDRLKQDQLALQEQLTQWQTILDQTADIEAGQATLQALQQNEQIWASKFETYQVSQQQLQQLDQQLAQQASELDLQIRACQTQLDHFAQQEQEIQVVLEQQPEVQAGLKQLSQYRDRLQQLDCLQQQVAPLLQQRQTLKADIERAEARLQAKLEQLQASTQELSGQLEQVPQMQAALFSVAAKIQELEKTRVYQQRVQEKGAERRNLQERLQENQRTCDRELEELRQKLLLLQTPGANCPLCEQGMNDVHRQQVIQKMERQQDELQQQFWVIREQISVCERELQLLRAEYTQLTDVLNPSKSLQQQLGQLEAQLETTTTVRSQLQQMEAERALLERSLQTGDYAEGLQAELSQLEQQLRQLNYDDQTHALVRGEVERWRWTEIKQAKIEEALKRQQQLARQQPEFRERLTQLHRKRDALQQESDLSRERAQLSQALQELNYERAQHQACLEALREAQSWQLRYQELQQARQQHPQLEKRQQTLAQSLAMRVRDCQAMEEQLARLTHQINELGDRSVEIQALETQIQQQRHELDQRLAQQGRLEESLAQLAQQQVQYDAMSVQGQNARQQYRVYQELAQAFGKNGIQALMIENILPQLETQTNQILARLTGNQLHVQFLTQRASKSRSKRRSKKQGPKLIDTLDIIIADVQGTRAYETYSGGEAFRINFAIRLALAQLLAQQAGTTLQMLIIDEGFGTQDAEGCDRLIAAINAITADFSCILAVTHMPQFKEAFQQRIEVRKTEQGSQLELIP